MGLISLKAKKYKHALMHLSPLFVAIIVFVSIFTYYQMKEFGNLPFVSTQPMNMQEVTIKLDAALNNSRNTVPIYKAPGFTNEEANAFVHHFFKNIHLNTADMEIIAYQNEGVYWIRGERSHNIWLKFLDGSYSYTDFSIFNEGIELIDADEETLVSNLQQFGIQVPKEALFNKINTGTYEWTLDKQVLEDQLLDGFIRISYYNDETVKEISNKLITYEKVKDVQIKSEQEAYEEILAGKFRHYSNNKIRSLNIHNVELSYYLDTKGYFQPVYAFYSTVDGMESIILIPAI